MKYGAKTPKLSSKSPATIGPIMSVEFGIVRCRPLRHPKPAVR